MRKKGFVQITHKLIKLGTALNHRTFRLIVYLMSFKPCFPSREQIKQEAGLTDDAISKGLAQAQKYNILSYKKGNSKGNSNEYFFNEESEWVLPQVSSYKEKKATSESEDDHIKNMSRTTSESTGVPHQKAEPNKSNANYTKEKENNDLNQFRNNKETFISAENQEKLILKLTGQLHKIYGELYPQKLDMQFDRQNEGGITSDELATIWKRYVVYLKSGGSLRGLIQNEFVRLEPKKQRRLPEPRFLTSKDSRKSYLHKVRGEAQAEDFSKCFGPIDFKDLKTIRKLDKNYHLCLAAFRHLMKVKSIEQYAIDSILGKKKLPLLGPYLFKYAIVKEYYFEETKLTKSAWEFYLEQIELSDYTPFLVQRAVNLDFPEMEGWPRLGITRGGGIELEMAPLVGISVHADEFNFASKTIH